MLSMAINDSSKHSTKIKVIMPEIQSKLTCNIIAIPDYQGQAGSGPVQPDLAMYVFVHCRKVGLDDLKRSLPALRVL